MARFKTADAEPSGWSQFWTPNVLKLVAAVFVLSLFAASRFSAPSSGSSWRAVLSSFSLAAAVPPPRQDASDWLHNQRFANETGYRPSLPAHILQKGVVSYGDLSRLRQVLSKLFAGKPIAATAVGGSVTWGARASQIGVSDYASLFFKWINETFPYVTHNLTNRGIPGTSSAYMSLCADRHIPLDSDLVVLEYCVNDGLGRGDSPQRRSHERLVRKLLARPQRPAVVELAVMRWPSAYDANLTTNPYRWGGDDEIGVLAQFYHLPWLSTRTLWWEHSDDGRNGFPPRYMMDSGHPNDRGHRHVADLLIALMGRAAEDLSLRPLTSAEVASTTRPLWPPLYRDNLPASGETCFTHMEFRKAIVKSENFSWVNEGTNVKQKWGLVSTRPGSWAVLRVNTGKASIGVGGWTNSSKVNIAYLKSYEHMGQMSVECTAGCKCDKSVVDGHHHVRVSQMYLHGMTVTRNERCDILVTVLPETSPGQNKVKLIGVIISPDEGAELPPWMREGT